ncbi:protein preY, mitochondrial-like [Plectropomus leopardus]|uniref:LOW QUALITY PROTEIN: protein preY, mitochondrial-like n=1 Tax=Plectropomus leopardus TaxID=160734 RepID=UPI001C4AC34F|nr:LOW QUALITY PROTEIN: protein preY, mitochondrial-like [Plectropomus leopardus]XP_042370155.1 protein preY, mitochondrial-like [Plectropomus leopardus]
MFRRVLGRLVTETVFVQQHVSPAAVCPRPSVSSASLRSFSDVKDEVQPPFDASLLHVLVCPLSKKPLRYEPKTNELINEELGIAYPIIDGIPNMIPQEARLLQKDPDNATSTGPTPA